MATRATRLDTKFGADILGTRICNNWDEIKKNGGTDFDVVIIGSGTCGGYLAEKLHRADGDKKPRVLVIEQGPFLLATHFQNLGGSLTGSIDAFPDFTGDAKQGENLGEFRADVWNTPWVSNEKFRGLACCVGGRSLFWAGWSPELKPNDLKHWPADIRGFLADKDGYAHVGREIGAKEDTVYITTTQLYKALHQALDGILPSGGKPLVENLTDFGQAPLAVMGSPPQAGVFPFDKFSSVTALLDAVCGDEYDPADPNGFQKRRLFILPRARVLGLKKTGDTVVSLDLAIDGETRKRTLPVRPGAVVVLANGTIEATRLALNDLDVGEKVGTSGTRRVGNLMAHLRSNIGARIRRTALSRFGFPATHSTTELEVAAFIVRGEQEALDRRFHFQVIAASVPKDPRFGLPIWSMIPDVDRIDDLLRNQGDEWVSINFTVVGEIGGRLKASTSRVSNDGKPAPNDRYKIKRANVWFELTPDDQLLWDAMDLAALRLARQIAGSAADVEYTNKEFKGKTLETIVASFAQIKASGTSWRDPIGYSHHEGGPLYMGQSGDGSITDTFGKLHNIKNAYVVGPAVFPTMGSANPTLTALTLAGRTAQAIVKAIQ